MLIDTNLIESIMRVTCSILSKYFFYDEDSLMVFLNRYSERVVAEYNNLEDRADEAFRKQMKNDRTARKYFTSYFASYHLHDCLVEDCHFTDMELDQFENILPKYHTGAKADGLKQSEQRENYRGLFKGL